MSDIAQGALIGIAGVVVGAIIAAISSYIIAKSQINARRDELNQQLSHQERETKVNRLIEARKEQLIQLRHALSDYIEYSRQGTNMLARVVDKSIKNKGKSLEKKGEIKEFFNIMERGKQLFSQLEVLRGQLSDYTLNDLITALLDRQLEIDTARMPILTFLNNPREANIKTLESASKQDESLCNAQRKELIKVNKRIEELLSGEPSN